MTAVVPTYTVVESSSVRIVLQVNERAIASTGGTKTAALTTRWTVYPTGQIFRWDSLSSWNSNGTPAEAFSAMTQRYAAGASGSFIPRPNMRGVVYNNGAIHDNVMAFLGFKYNAGTESFPWSGSGDTINIVSRSPVATGQHFFHETTGSTAAWTGVPVQTAIYYDYQRDDLSDGLFRDSVSNGVQCLVLPTETEVLGMINGTLVKTSAGDLNGDGFNEREGAYVMSANNNAVHFRLPARTDTCRYYPVFRITNYLSNQKPGYVTCYHPHTMGGTPPDTTVLIEGYDYSIYHNKTARELVIQIDSVFCDSAIFWISADRTLAVTMSRFEAKGGDGCDTVKWRTESELENLGYFLYRRIKPSFMDSLARAMDSTKAGNEELDNAAQLFKRKAIVSADTGWHLLNTEIIPGAPRGASLGPIEYTQIDKTKVYNDVVYEYKVMAMDYHNRTDEYGPAEARPRALNPMTFALWNNYPNPFNRVTNIKFDLPVASKVTLNIYSLQGRLIKRLVKPDRKWAPGRHNVVWDATGEFNQPVAAGPYIYHFITEKKFIKTRVMMLVR
jgi:hypothetical protein